MAENQIRGKIPRCFGDFSSMKRQSSDYHDSEFFPYGELIIDNSKGNELEYTSTLGFLFSIDLSDNYISGDIPEELMDLSGLLNLNLAGNHISGRIPDMIGNLEKLEILDLSRNELYGTIPQSLAELNFLSRLNLSFNKLSGRIPSANQLQTLDDPSIYAGNNELCGQPLLKSCTSDTQSQIVHDYNEAGERMWFYAGIGPGLLVGFLGFYVSLHFINSWSSSSSSSSCNSEEDHAIEALKGNQKHMSLLLLVYPLIVVTYLKFGSGSITGGHKNRSCIENEKQALLLLKKSFVDDQNLLLSWTGDDCCSWDGIECNNVTGHVTKLYRGSSGLKGSISKSIRNLTALTLIDLSDNLLEGIIPESIGNLKSLTVLDLAFNNLQGFIPQSIGNLTSLTSLDLSRNEIGGLIPESIGALTSLSELHLSRNKLRGSIPQSIRNLTSLSQFDLSYNRFNSSIPSEIGYLTELTTLYLSTNEFSGFLTEAVCQLSKLLAFSIDDNQLSGSIPGCIGELSDLVNLDLSSNSWEGLVSEHHFVNLTKLTHLKISSKSDLVLNVSDKWVPPFQLQEMSMESWKVGPKFPKWLLTQINIWDITMANTSISDTLLAIPNSLQYLDLSSNHLVGKFPPSLCNLTESLREIHLSDNDFSGELPQCLGNLTFLEVLDVRSNELSGNIPFSLGSLGLLSNLNLHNNKFQGRLPLSFVNLTGLVGLDVGKNNLSDVLPSWKSNFKSHLRYLILRSNNFYGKIPTELCHYESIQILNLARNHITGSIPHCFGNFTSIITSNNHSDDDFPYSSLNNNVIIDDAKGSELAYTTTLELLFSIDLSNNDISGEIPEELMDLHGLLGLNLAGNHLTGRIPDRIGKLDKLEFLDLSRNELYGPIPQSLSNLNFLSRLNLSFNDLSGKIPTGNQLQTLNDPSIYVGNNQLCGGLILDPCPSDTDSHDFQDNNKADVFSDDEHMWFYSGIGPGLLVGLLGFFASLHFIKSWRYSYFHYIEQVFDKIAVSIAFLRKKFCN